MADSRSKMSNTGETDLRIYVFTYNRPEFLSHCIDSVTRHAPDYPLTIIDDNSDDAQTRRLVAELSHKHNVIQPDDSSDEHTFKTGGLYPNKNIALDDAERAGARYALFIHHDMQLVRPIRRSDIACFDRFFAANENSMELQICFMKKHLQEWDEKYAQLDESRTAYFRDPANAKGHKYFSGSGIFNIERVRNKMGWIQIGEKANEDAAKALDARMGFYAWPLLMWLPFPISYRGKKRSLTLRALEYVGGGGFHPINDMPESREAEFLERSLDIQPVAERYLECPGVPRQARYWSTMGGRYNVVALERGWRKRLGKLLRKFHE